MSVTNRKLRVFLCHASQDGAAVRGLYQRLKSEGWIEPWLDKENLLPGQEWDLEIERAVEQTDVVLVFLSSHSVDKEGYVQKELRLVLNIAEEKPEGTIFIVPLRLDDCILPRRLRMWHYVDVFEDGGYHKILQTLRSRSKSINLLESEAIQYDLDIVNDMLRSLPDRQLRSLVYEEMSSLLDKINWSGYTFSTVSEIILYAQKESKISNVVKWVSKNAPDVYSNYSYDLGVQISAQDNLVVGNKNIINLNRAESRKKARNPYVTGNPIQPSNRRVFCGRLDIAESIVHEIRGSRQKPSFLLYGRRRMGKTSALLNLQRLIKDIKIIDVLISGQNSKFHTDLEFCYYLSDTIIRTTKENLLISEENTKWKKYSDFNFFHANPALALSTFFDAYHEFLETNDLYCLLMLDEYEEFGNLSRGLLLQLRDTLQHKPRFIFIFSGVSHINELPNPFWGEVFINVRTLKISFLQHNDGYKLLTEPAPGLVYKSQKIIEDILDVTGGQPFLLQAIAAELFNSFNLSSKSVVAREDLESSIRKVFGSWKNYFDGYLWQKECSTDIHKNIVLQIARDGKLNKSTFSKHQLEINDLIEKDILKIQNGYLQLTMPILGTWLEQMNYL